MAVKKSSGSVGTNSAVNVTIRPPNFEVLAIRIVGTSPLVCHRFSNKARAQMKAKQLAGSRSRKGATREPRNFEEDYEGAKHVSIEGWCGFPAGGLRQAMISACRLVGFKMTIAKLAIFVESDGLERDDAMPLVRINGTPRQHESFARNETGVADIRSRPLWEKWSMDLRVRYDGDLFTPTDIINLLLRAGQQVGIGEGRPDSRQSAGLGWGMFMPVQTANEFGEPVVEEAA